METKEAKAAIEAVLFASGEPVSIQRLADALGMAPAAVRQIASLLRDDYEERQGGIELLCLNDNYQLSTRGQYAEQVHSVLESKRNAPLSNAAMEVLSIIAYNQPVTKSFVEQVRGVESGQIVNNLVEKGLVAEAGRLDVPGRPVAYRTSLDFLRCFGLESLDQLPALPDESGQVLMEEVVAEAAEKEIAPAE